MTDGDSERGSGDRSGGFRPTRRTVLGAAAGAAGVGAVASLGLGQQSNVELGGAVSGWVGRAPEAIADETNPTLTLVAGETYTVVWENLDGAPHNFVVVDGDGNELVSSEILDEQGATQTVEFEATEEMAEYFCSVHPSSMRGTIQLGQATPTPEETPTPGPPPGYFSEGPTVGLELVASEPLIQPVGLETADEDVDRRFVVDQLGQIYVHGPEGEIESEPFLDIQDRLVEVGAATDVGFDERGLLGLAFHPEFADTGRFFVRYSSPPREGTPTEYDHTEVLSEFQATDDLTSADPDSERVLLEIPSPQFNHNAGDIAFGPDDLLYMGMGDGGGANDTGLGHVEDWYEDNDGGNGQDVTQNLLGSILRLDVDSEGDERPYGIPEDNPLVDAEGRDEQYAWGMRNPWRMSFDDDRLFVADVGQNLFEEVDIVERGGNYGWNVKEGTHCFSPASPLEPPAECPDSTPEDVRGGEPLIDPIIEYPHTFEDEPVGISVTGGHVYRGDAVEELQGRYVFADYSRSGSNPQGRLLVANEPDGEETEETPTGAMDEETPTEEEAEDGTPTEGEMEETPTEDEAEDGTPTDRDDDVTLWDVEEVLVADSPNDRINRFVLAFGEGRDDELYVMTSNTGIVRGDGFVYRIVPPGEGEEVEPPEEATPTPVEGTPTEGEEATPTQEEGTPTATEEGTPTEGVTKETPTEAEGTPTEEDGASLQRY